MGPVSDEVVSATESYGFSHYGARVAGLDRPGGPGRGGPPGG